MTQWEYLTLDLNDLPRKAREIDLLNTAGEDGWELVVITVNRIAFFKRQIEDDPVYKLKTTIPPPLSVRRPRGRSPRNASAHYR